MKKISTIQGSILIEVDKDKLLSDLRQFNEDIDKVKIHFEDDLQLHFVGSEYEGWYNILDYIKANVKIGGE